MNKRGFTLIEAIISLAILMVFSVGIYSMLLNTTEASNKFRNSSSSFAAAKTSLNFLAHYLEICDEFQLNIAPNGSGYYIYDESNSDVFSGRLDTLRVRMYNESSKEIKVFSFITNYQSHDYNVLAFGGKEFDDYQLQVLADHITDITVNLNGFTKLLTITVIVDNGKTPRLELTKQIDLSYKHVPSI